MIISIHAEIPLGKIQHSLIIKTQQITPRRNYLIIKCHICQVLCNMLHDKRVKALPVRSGTKGALPFLPILLSTVNGSPTIGKRNKRYQIQKERS